jgi:hypothetical protein
MTERELILLGFKIKEIKEYDEDDSYYYSLKIVNGLEFITPMNDEIENDKWYVEFFDTDPLIRFHDFGIVQGLINKLTGAIVKKN